MPARPALYWGRSPFPFRPSCPRRSSRRPPPRLPRQEVAIVAELGESPLLEVVLDAVRLLAGRIADGDDRLGARVLEAELEGRLRARELRLLPCRQEIVLLEFVGEDHRALPLRIDVDQREMAVLLGLDGEHPKVVHLVV